MTQRFHLHLLSDSTGETLENIAKAALALAMRKAAGRFVHDNDGIVRAAAGLPVRHTD